MVDEQPNLDEHKSEVVQSPEELLSEELRESKASLPLTVDEEGAPGPDKSTPESEAFAAVREINQRIAPFCITERLGSGAMAEIYLARCSATDRVVAIKALRSDIRDATISARFRLEFDLLRRLNHSAIAKAFAFQTGDPTFFTMEYVKGDNLRQHFSRNLRELKTDRDTVIKLGKHHAGSWGRGKTPGFRRGQNIGRSPGTHLS